MRTILKIGYRHYALKPDANVTAILKALSAAIPVRPCYTSEKPVKFRAYHDPSKRDCDIEIVMIDPRQVGPADPCIDDDGTPIEKPAKRGLMLGAGE